MDKTAPSRPIIYDYASPREFFVALAIYNRERSVFSVRQQIKKYELDGFISPALVSLVLSGKRRINRDLLPVLAKIFKATTAEISYLDQLMIADLSPSIKSHELPATSTLKAEPRNHLLRDWINVYVKDTVNLRGFEPSGTVIYRLLNGMAPRLRIEKAVRFLLAEGFWRHDGKGNVVPEASITQTSSGIPLDKIRKFHKAALKIALKGIEQFPPGRRKAYTTVVSVDRSHAAELKTLVDRFHHDLQSFISSHPSGSDQLFQVAIHLTPIGGLDGFSD